VDNLEAAFHPVAKRAARKVSDQEEKIARLEAKLQQKNEVISELMEENVRAKKSIGEL
jgi:transposase